MSGGVKVARKPGKKSNLIRRERKKKKGGRKRKTRVSNFANWVRFLKNYHSNGSKDESVFQKMERKKTVLV
jgi:hypothetical protein